jgi:hypothetical protein
MGLATQIPANTITLLTTPTRWAGRVSATPGDRSEEGRASRGQIRSESAETTDPDPAAVPPITVVSTLTDA